MISVGELDLHLECCCTLWKTRDMIRPYHGGGGGHIVDVGINLSPNILCKPKTVGECSKI